MLPHYNFSASKKNEQRQEKHYAGSDTNHMGVTNKNNVPQERPTGNTIQSSFDNTYNLPNNTAENQTEQNLFSVNKDTSQHIQISADPSTSTPSHDCRLRVDSSHQVIVEAIDPSPAANNSNVDNFGIQAIMPIISRPDHELINKMESNIFLV